MGKNKKGKSSDFITYLLFTGILSILRRLPKKLARSFCVKLGRAAYKLDKKHREITINNLKMAFKEKSDDEILDISRKVFENIGATIFDYALIPAINEDNFQDYFEFEGTEYVKDALDKKKGILFISGHLCCWEMLSCQSFLFGGTSVLAKDLHNRYVDNYVKKIRSKNDVQVIPTRHSVGRVIKILKNGGSVYTLLDQNTRRHEAVFVDFFDRKAATVYFAALLALKLVDISIIPTFVKRDGEFKYKIYYLEPFEIIRTSDRKKDILDNTQALTKIIEDEVRKKPEDWFWVHDRWK
jgi:KDO2-lipid IV(A) lauroyltransferase